MSSNWPAKQPAAEYWSDGLAHDLKIWGAVSTNVGFCDDAASSAFMETFILFFVFAFVVLMLLAPD